MTQSPDAAGGIRGRFRAHIRDEVKQAALRQLKDGGPPALSINAIAKELGVSGPALYRYFTNRDDLLTELVVDAYRDLAVAVNVADERRGNRRQRPAARLHAFATAYRRWAVTEPHRYRLLYTAPLPGYDPQSERLVAASQEAMDLLLDVLAELMGEQLAADSSAAVRGRPSALDRQIGVWARARGRPGIDPRVGVAAVVAWTRIHGLVSLEIEGNYASMGLEPDLLFEQEVGAILTAATTARW